MSSIISIAAQSPTNIHSLEAMSFKAFHKNVKNRFTNPEMDKKSLELTRIDAEKRYKQDVKDYNYALASLQFYMLRMSKSNFESELVDMRRYRGGLRLEGGEDSYMKAPMSPDVAKNMASKIDEMKKQSIAGPVGALVDIGSNLLMASNPALAIGMQVGKSLFS